MPSGSARKAPRKPKPLDLEGLTAYAARVLAGRAQSISELRDKLRRRAAERDDVDTVIAHLKGLGYVNDQRFAESFANWRRDHEGQGRTRVLRDLLARRVAPAVAQQASEKAFEGSDEVAMIEQFLARKYRGKNLGALLQEEKHLASAYRRLRMAGFSTGNSIRVLKRHAAAEQMENIERLEETGDSEE